MPYLDDARVGILCSSGLEGLLVHDGYVIQVLLKVQIREGSHGTDPASGSRSTEHEETDRFTLKWGRYQLAGFYRAWHHPAFNDLSLTHPTIPHLKITTLNLSILLYARPFHRHQSSIDHPPLPISNMESIRNAMGYGVQSGQEPLSGQTGQGTADEPYDSGNLAGTLSRPSFMSSWAKHSV